MGGGAWGRVFGEDASPYFWNFPSSLWFKIIQTLGNPDDHSGSHFLPMFSLTPHFLEGRGLGHAWGGYLIQAGKQQACLYSLSGFIGTTKHLLSDLYFT